MPIPAPYVTNYDVDVKYVNAAQPPKHKRLTKEMHNCIYKQYRVAQKVSSHCQAH